MMCERAGAASNPVRNHSKRNSCIGLVWNWSFGHLFMKVRKLPKLNFLARLFLRFNFQGLSGPLWQREMKGGVYQCYPFYNKMKAWPWALPWSLLNLLAKGYQGFCKWVLGYKIQIICKGKLTVPLADGGSEIQNLIIIQLYLWANKIWVLLK